MTTSFSRRTFLQAAAGVTGAGAARSGQSAAAQPAAGTASGPVTCAGFFDLQVNGFGGVDFNDPALTASQVAEAAEKMQATGVTLFLATLISQPLAHFAPCARTLVRSGVPALAGLHMEGPYISPEDGARGAHRREDIEPPTIDDFARRQEAAEGHITVVTIAPEVAGAMTLIDYMVKHGVRVSIGHTAAPPEAIREAIARGATLSTHLGNGCAQMLPRHPNFVWEQLAADELSAGFIVDGHHLPPATVKAMMRAKTPARSILVTDAIIAAGQPPGDYMLGDVRVHVDDTGRVGLPDSPYLAGSALALDRAVGNTVRFTGLPLDQVLPMASTQPAAAVGLKPRGQIDAEWDAANAKFFVKRVRV